MRKSVLVAGVVATAFAAATVPIATPAVADEHVVDESNDLDLSTPEAVEAFLASLGISPARVEEFANGLGISAQEYYERAARANADPSSVEAPIEFVDGKIQYNNTVVDTMAFTRTSTRVQQGSAIAGACAFEDLTAEGNLGSESVVSEVVEVDLDACNRTVFDGVYDPKANTPAEATTQAGPTFLDCNSLTNPPTTYQPWLQPVDGQNLRYYKQSFVDPVCITITSSTLNVRWKNQLGSATNVGILTGTAANPYYYTDLGEDWPEDQKLRMQAPGYDGTAVGNGSVPASFFHKRTETDFPEHLALAATIAGGGVGFLFAIAACNWDLSDTVFRSDQLLHLQRNGGWWANGSGDYAGGCSSLIHERVWHGGGTYAR